MFSSCVSFPWPQSQVTTALAAGHLTLIIMQFWMSEGPQSAGLRSVRRPEGRGPRLSGNWPGPTCRASHSTLLWPLSPGTSPTDPSWGRLPGGTPRVVRPASH